ncbi:MAG: hypothetical protein EA371_09290 [Gammaproteobacteria bacterium]|nr:MAG: hypothetical protein EA371_09290 [Gammaproteobacteria bacterium]
MSTSTLIIIELLLIVGIVFGLAARELISLRRERRKDEQARSAASRTSGHAERQHELHDRGAKPLE